MLKKSLAQRLLRWTSSGGVKPKLSDNQFWKTETSKNNVSLILQRTENCCQSEGEYGCRSRTLTWRWETRAWRWASETVQTWSRRSGRALISRTACSCQRGRGCSCGSRLGTTLTAVASGLSTSQVMRMLCTKDIQKGNFEINTVTKCEKW